MQVPGSWGSHSARVLRVFLIAVTLWQGVGYSQVRPNSGSQVRGRVLDGNPGSSLSVRLSKVLDAGAALSAEVSPDGYFTFGSVVTGSYWLQVKNPQGQTIYESPVSIGGSRDLLTVRLPAASGQQPPSGTVSVHQLQMKIAPKALKEQEKGMHSFRNQEFKEAVAHFRKAVGFDPSFAEAYNMLGSSFLSLKQADEAATQFRTATALDPHSASFAANLANALVILEQYPESETSARAALAEDRNLKEARYFLGFSRYKQGKYDQETVENLQWAAIEYPRARIFAAEVLRRLGRHSEAAAELQGYLKSSDQGVDRSRVQAWISQLTEPSGQRRQELPERARNP